MKSYGQVAASVRQRKEAHPEKYCANPKCLWRTDEKYCPRHTPTPTDPALRREVAQ